MPCQDEALLGGRRGAEQERGDTGGEPGSGPQGTDSEENNFAQNLVLSVPRYKIYHRKEHLHVISPVCSNFLAKLSSFCITFPRSKAQLSKQLRQCAEKMRSKKDHAAKEGREGQRLDDLLGEIKSFWSPCVRRGS